MAVKQNRKKVSKRAKQLRERTKKSSFCWINYTPRRRIKKIKFYFSAILCILVLPCRENIKLRINPRQFRSLQTLGFTAGLG